MDPRTATTLLLAVTITMLVGCETPKTNSQKRMGDATRATVQLMEIGRAHV